MQSFSSREITFFALISTKFTALTQELLALTSSICKDLSKGIILFSWMHNISTSLLKKMMTTQDQEFLELMQLKLDLLLLQHRKLIPMKELSLTTLLGSSKPLKGQILMSSTALSICSLLILSSFKLLWSTETQFTLWEWEKEPTISLSNKQATYSLLLTSRTLSLVGQ